jgi:flagellar biosynthesis protein FliQ
MEVAEVLDYGRDAILVLVLVCAPVMGVGMVVGLAVSVVQAVTQIQEMTLTFVPKILAIFLSLLLFMPFMLNQLTGFMERTAQRIAGLD